MTATVHFNPLGQVVETPSGTRCGNHRTRTYHDNPDSVRECYLQDRLQREAAGADYEHERYAERAWEQAHEVPLDPQEEEHERWAAASLDGWFATRGGYHQALYTTNR